ncbi:hypothetical protein L873DRAFT_1786872 [Choiromyces venosus 120613-1]|uniref:RRM domain-containing protein n=1 Tax=Choiromyces venosus 120613-1 TaxID=1336337 RepID=A0A3N4KBV4_9PEZI|nr:hypothetical protein L873DRAFT_1786872 [Choiromyces venosus 120613-1]
MSNVMDSPNGQENGPVTPTNRSRSNTMSTNPFSNDMIRYQNPPYASYADSRSGSQTNEESDDANVIYVSGIVSSIEDSALYEMFSQIVDILRRHVGFETKPSGIQQYAFVKFASVEDAQRALQVAEVILGDRKLTIKPRERRPRRFFPREDSGYGRPDSRKEHAFEQQYQDHNGGQNNLSATPNDQAGGYDPNVTPGVGMRSPDDNGDACRPQMLMSKALFVAGLPFDMSPKELFMLFAEQGPVEGCYIFPFLDPFGRRFGHMVMATFFAAQKAQETFDKCTIRNCLLEVGYRHLEPLMAGAEYNSQQPGFQGPPTPSFPMYCPTATHQNWTQHPFMGQIPTAAGIGPQMMAFNQSYLPFSPSHVPPSAYGHQQIHMMPPAGIDQSYVQYGTPPNSPPFHPHAFGWQAQGRGMNRPFQGGNGRNFARRPSYRATASNFAPSSPGTGSGDQHIRSISNSSSSTLVSGASEQKTHGPIIVNGSYPYGGYSTPQHDRNVKEETSPSDEQSTPSPVAVRSAHIPQETETPTRSVSKPTFQAIVPEAVPETPKPADPANLFVKNFDDDIISDPDDLKKLFEPYGPVASAHLAMIPGTNRSIGYGFVAFTKADDAANAKSKLNGSMVGKKRLFVSYAERKEERTQRLKLHFKKGRNGYRNDGNEQDSSNSESAQAQPSDNGEEGSTEGTEKGEKDGSVEKGPSTPPPEKNASHPEHVPDKDVDVLKESSEASQTAEDGGQGSSTTGILAVDDRPPLTPVENVPHILTEQDTAGATRWRGRTQLTGITEVEEEEAAAVTANGDVTATYTEPTLPQIHDHVSEGISGRCQSSNFQDQIKEQRPQGESAQPEASGDFLRPNGSNNNFHRQQRYDNRSPSPHNGNRGHGGQYHNHGQNGNGRGYRGYGYQNQSYGRGGPRFYGNNRSPGNGGYHQSFNNPPPNGRTVFFNNSTQPFSTESSHEPIGPQNQHRKKKWQGGNRNGRGGQQQRGSPVNIDHHTVNNVMLDVSDTGQGAVTAY